MLMNEGENVRGLRDRLLEEWVWGDLELDNLDAGLQAIESLSVRRDIPFEEFLNSTKADVFSWSTQFISRKGAV